MAGALEGDVFIGKKAQEFRGLLKIKYPMEHGIVTDWDDMERIWSWVYAEELGTLSEEVRGCSSFCRDCSRCAVLLASCTIDRSTAKPSSQPRRCRTNILRHFQCTRSIYLCASCTFIVRHPILRCSHNQYLKFLADTHQAEQQALFLIPETVSLMRCQCSRASQCHTQFGEWMSPEG